MSDRRRLTRRRALGLTAGLGLGSLAPSFASRGRSSPRPARLLAESAYPKGQRPRLLSVLAEDSLSPAERTLATTLQGLLARRGSETLYLNIPSLGYQIWLDDLVSRYGVHARTGDLWKTVSRSGVDGYVLFRTGTPSVNVATTLAGLTGAVAIEESLEAPRSGTDCARSWTCGTRTTAG